METRFLVKTLMQDPPEPLRRVMRELDGSEDIGQWEQLHLELSRELGRAMLEARLRLVAEPAESPCPRCTDPTPESQPLDSGVSPPLSRVRRRRERVVVSALGPLRLTRRTYRCGRCGGEHAALDRALGVTGQTTAQAAQMSLSLLVEMPSRRASRMLVDLCGLRISSATIERLKDRVGRQTRRRLEQEERQWLAPVDPDHRAPAPQEASPALLVRQADAVKVRYRDGWHDVKVGVSYGLGEPDDRGRRRRTMAPKYCAIRGKAQALGAQIQALSLSQGLRRAPASQFVSDGGNWMAGLAENELKWSEWTVDYYHVAQQTASALKALYGEGSTRAQKAYHRFRKKLLEAGGNGAVRRSLRGALRNNKHLDAEARRTVSNVVDYLRRFEDQTRYDRLRRRSWPIGSGQIEGGGCKLYIQGRFKRAGARWTEQGFDALEALRRCAYNNQWHEVRESIYSLN